MLALFASIGIYIFASLVIALSLVVIFASKGSLRKKEGIYYLQATFLFGVAMCEAISAEFNPTNATTSFVLFALYFLASVGFALNGADIGNKSYNKTRL
jgi:hypothetical protein